MTANCLIRVSCKTKILMKAVSLSHDVDGKPIETYDSIIRRAIESLNGGQQ